MKIISFSLWGTNPKYTTGAIENSILINTLLSDYTPRFYVYECVPLNIINKLKENSEVIIKKGIGNWNGMFDRFLPMSKPNVEIFHSRDCDSRISPREIFAIRDFEKSDKTFHIMRDHPYHTTEILGGMFGVKKGVINNIEELINNFNKQNKWQTDQDFLKQVIYPLLNKNDILVHDEFFNYNFNKLPFPSKRIKDEYVGSVIDEHGNRNEEHHKILLNYLK